MSYGSRALAVGLMLVSMTVGAQQPTRILSCLPEDAPATGKRSFFKIAADDVQQWQEPVLWEVGKWVAGEKNNCNGRPSAKFTAERSSLKLHLKCSYQSNEMDGTQVVNGTVLPVYVTGLNGRETIVDFGNGTIVLSRLLAIPEKNRLEPPSIARFNRCQEAAEPSPRSKFDTKKD